MDETDESSDNDDGSYDSDASSSTSDSGSSTDSLPITSPSPLLLERGKAVPSLGKMPLITAACDEDNVSNGSFAKSSTSRRDSGGQRSAVSSANGVTLPMLSLNGNGGASTSQSSATAALRLDLAAARPPLPSPAGHGSARSSGRHRSGSHRGPALSVDLLSSAFAIDKDTLRQGEQSGAGPASVARQRAAAGLGVPSALLRLFELREVPQDGDLQPGAQRVAFSIPDSSFSLSAVEETMSDNKRLMATNSHTTAALEALQQLVKDQNTALAKLKVQAGETAGNSRRLQERCDNAENLASALRQQLDRSEQLRIQAQAALSGIKHEFEALTTELLAETQGRGSGDVGSVSPHLIAQAAAVQKRTITEPPPNSAMALLGGKHGERLTAVLERFSDEKVLSRLEQCLDKAAAS